MSASDCSRIQDALGDYVAGGLSACQREAVNSHLALCGDCRSALEEVRLVLEPLIASTQAGSNDQEANREMLWGVWKRLERSAEPNTVVQRLALVREAPGVWSFCDISDSYPLAEFDLALETEEDGVLREAPLLIMDPGDFELCPRGFALAASVSEYAGVSGLLCLADGDSHYVNLERQLCPDRFVLSGPSIPADLQIRSLHVIEQ